MNKGKVNLSPKDGLRQKVANAVGADMQRLLAYFGLYENSFGQGSIPSCIKHLIALAIAIRQRNLEGITHHTSEAMRAGASRNQIQEAVTIAVFVGGVLSFPAGAEALAEVARCEAQKMISPGEPSFPGSHDSYSVSSAFANALFGSAEK